MDESASACQRTRIACWQQNYPRTWWQKQCRRVQGLPAQQLSGAFAYIGRLRSLLSFGDFELYLITFLQAFITLGRDGAIVNKNVGTVDTSDEPVAFCVIEPLYRAFHRSTYPLRTSRVGDPRDVTAIRMHFVVIGMECQD